MEDNIKKFYDFLMEVRYKEKSKKKSNKRILDLLSDMLAGSTWTENEIPIEGFNPKNAETYLRCIYTTRGDIKLHYKHAEKELENIGKEITPKNIQDITIAWNFPISAEEYINRDEIIKKHTTQKEKIESGNFTPSEVLNMISDNWDELYNSPGTYEALAYCLVISENHKKVQNFNIKLDALIRSIIKN